MEGCCINEVKCLNRILDSELRRKVIRFYDMGSYESNKIYRKKYPERRNIERQRYYDQFSGRDINFNHWQPWTVSELNLLDANITDRKLHKIIGRSVKAIQVKRARIKKEDRRLNDG